MRTIFIHGIHQQGRNAEAIQAEWIGALNRAIPNLETVFYGDALVAAMEPGEATIMGVPLADDERSFVAAALRQIAIEYGFDLDQDQAVSQGVFDNRVIIGVAKCLNEKFPALGDLALSLVRQAYAYLKRPAATAAVDEIVRPVIAAGPCIVVAHSLGTVVSYKLLRSLGQQVPLLLTLGSPLGLAPVQNALGRPRVKPDGVARWWNGLDPNDAVTLGTPLTVSTFAEGVVNKTTIDNGDEPHAITRYLKDPDVRAEIAAALARP